MAVVSEGGAVQTAVIGTEHILLDIAESGVFVFEVNTKNMAAGDVLELRISLIMLTGETRDVAYFYTYTGAQSIDDRVKIFPPVSNDLTDTGSVRCTLKQTLGTGRNYSWKVLKHV